MRTCLIVGGAGYVGSHFNKVLSAAGRQTVVYDNLVYGHREAVKWGEFVLGDLEGIGQLRLAFKKYRPDAAAHFSAFAYVGESVLESIISTAWNWYRKGLTLNREEGRV